jgi:two-component system response regulator NreC
MGIRLMIVDDHGILRAGLANLLTSQPDIQVIGEADNGLSAIQMATKEEPDVILMDISMPEMDGIKATREIVQKLPNIRVLMLSLHDDISLVREAIKSGARGFILKKALKEELLAAIHEVMKDELYLNASMAKQLFSQLPQTEADKAHQNIEELTPREIDVLKFIASGYTNRQAADNLNLSVRTIEYHRSNIIAKLGLRSRVELMRYAEKKHIV